MPQLDLTGLMDVIKWMVITTAPYSVTIMVIDMAVALALKMMFGKGKWFVN